MCCVGSYIPVARERLTEIQACKHRRAKKEKTPSIARGWPMTQPVVRENCEPVCAELKFHRNSSNDADQEIDREDPCPEPRGSVVSFVFATDRNGLEDHDQQNRRLTVSRVVPIISAISSCVSVNVRCAARSCFPNWATRTAAV
jgi:hypothetical protein